MDRVRSSAMRTSVPKNGRQYRRCEARRANSSNAEVRIREGEARVEPLAHEIDARAIDRGQARAIHEQLDAEGFEYEVVRTSFIGVINDVAIPRAAGGLDAHAQPQAAAATREAIAHALGRRLA